MIATTDETQIRRVDMHCCLRQQNAWDANPGHMMALGSDVAEKSWAHFQTAQLAQDLGIGDAASPRHDGNPGHTLKQVIMARPRSRALTRSTRIAA